MTRSVAVIGGGIAAARAALTLANEGVKVDIITPDTAMGLEDGFDGSSIASAESNPHLWPLLLRAATHPMVTLHTSTDVRGIIGKQGRLSIRTNKRPRYVRRDICTTCGRCEDECSVKVNTEINGQKISHSAIHAPVPGVRTTPSAFYIEKMGVAACRVSCPLGISVQGFVSLLSKGKVDEALALINEAAPLAAILGRVCTHPCESVCKRSEVDSPVFIHALHRYAADNATGGARYTFKVPPGSRREKIAIVGSGPAGLGAAWELARRGYTPTIFEAHAVVGGMMATGIPRFRLPWEIRDREVASIQAMGVRIQRGVTVGRDLSISDLRERGYRAFFLAIGAHQNKSLDIPGENLEGVVDAISLLFALNSRVGASVGSNVVVIGGGNSAIDSARTAKRRSKGVVRVLYRRTEEEMTAVKEEVEEATHEGVQIEYLTQPIEILGDGYNVTGLRCQRMRMGDTGPDGRRQPEPIPGSEYVIDADHVVVAIGQKPNSALLRLARLKIDSEDATIAVDPLTLETAIPGVFAGGDCVTGPNTVVDAVAAGLRAAESIDRYLRNRDLRKGRTLDKPVPVEVDIGDRNVSHHRRTRMPSRPYSKRRGSFEEIALGLPDDAALREAGRCLNCALCSECMECERVCELGAVLHKEKEEHVEITVDSVVCFLSRDNGLHEHLHDHFSASSKQLTKPGVYTIDLDESEDLDEALLKSEAVALDVAIDIKQREERLTPEAPAPPVPAIDLLQPSIFSAAADPGTGRIGVALCNCGGSISSVIDFNQVINEIVHMPGVCHVFEISQACTREGAQGVRTQAEDWKLDKMVVAACRCCALDQVCFSCTERRVKCQQNLLDGMAASSETAFEFVNIREQCASIHSDDRAGATRKAIDIVRMGVARTKFAPSVVHEERTIEKSALVLGAGLTGAVAARNLANLGYSVAMVSGPEPGAARDKRDTEPEYSNMRAELAAQLEGLGIRVNPWPQRLGLSGTPGSYEVHLDYGFQVVKVRAGALVLTPGSRDGELAAGASHMVGGLLGRMLASAENAARSLAWPGSADARDVTIRETAGISILAVEESQSLEEEMLGGSALAARASSYLRHEAIKPRLNAVAIDSKLCRGCGDCAAICSLIEMQEVGGGLRLACVDRALCLGCGACIARCPTGAISQLGQSNEQIIVALQALLSTEAEVVGSR